MKYMKLHNFYSFSLLLFRCSDLDPFVLKLHFPFNLKMVFKFHLRNTSKDLKSNLDKDRGLYFAVMHALTFYLKLYYLKHTNVTMYANP